MELTSFHKKAYGTWAGNRVGFKPVPERCAEEVTPNDPRARTQEIIDRLEKK